MTSDSCASLTACLCAYSLSLRASEAADEARPSMATFATKPCSLTALTSENNAVNGSDSSSERKERKEKGKASGRGADGDARRKASLHSRDTPVDIFRLEIVLGAALQEVVELRRKGVEQRRSLVKGAQRLRLSAQCGQSLLPRHVANEKEWKELEDETPHLVRTNDPQREWRSVFLVTIHAQATFNSSIHLFISLRRRGFAALWRSLEASVSRWTLLNFVEQRFAPSTT